MQFQPRLEKRCLGQITKTQTKQYIIEGRGDCRECSYNAQENPRCKAYSPIAFRVFEVVAS